MKKLLPLFIFTLLMSNPIQAQYIASGVNLTSNSSLRFAYTNQYGNITYTNSIGVPINSTMTAVVWASYDPANGPFESTTLLFELTNKGFVKVTASGLLNGYGYFLNSSNTQGIYGTIAFLSPDINADNVLTADATSNPFYQIKVSIYLPYDIVSSSGGSVLENPFDPVAPADLDGQAIPLANKINAQGKLEVQKEELQSGGGNPIEELFGLEIRTLDVSSSGGAYASQSAGYVNFTQAMQWYQGSTFRDVVDAAMVGFTTLVAFLMPYQELRKGR